MEVTAALEKAQGLDVTNAPAKTHTTSRFAALICAFAALMLSFGLLTGCSGNAAEDAEKAAEAALAGELDAYKDGDPTMYEGDGFSGLESFGVDPVELKGALTEGFAYRINGAEFYPKSDAVIIDVSIDSRQLVSAVREVLPDVYASMFQSAYNGASQDELKATFVKQVMESVSKEPLTTTDIKVEMLQRDGQWVVSVSGEKQIQRAIMGNLNSLYEDIESINTAPTIDEDAIAKEAAKVS